MALYVKSIIAYGLICGCNLHINFQKSYCVYEHSNSSLKTVDLTIYGCWYSNIFEKFEFVTWINNAYMLHPMKLLQISYTIT